MDRRILERITREAGLGRGLLDGLVERLTPTDLQSLLMELQARMAAKVTPARVLEQFENNRFVVPTRADPRRLTDLDGLVWKYLPAGYQAVELAPLCPLGTIVALTNLSQNRIVSTVRNAEVVSDATNVLALECAVRRRALRCSERATDPVLLAASHRVTRAQKFNVPGASAHFRLLALCAAGRDEGTFRFEARQWVEQF